MDNGFWGKLEKPIIGLSPMDGVTDAAFRYMVCKHGNPSLTVTEFTNVEGLARGAVKMLVAFLYNEIERPVVAQIYGVEVESFYKATVMLCALGFDGVDINMGCPANKVARKGSGAALIQTPELAKEIVRTCKRASKDWANGISLEEAGVHEDIIEEVKVMLENHFNDGKSGEAILKLMPRNEIPISVKTRIGYSNPITEEWTNHLLEVSPAAIIMHGRTLKQMYMGQANWDEISMAAKLCREAGVVLLGNGDAKSFADAKEKCEKYGVDGVLAGRAVFGNPWFFSNHAPTTEDRLVALKEHSDYFEKLNHLAFHNLRKHLAWYCKEFAGARELRHKLMQTICAYDTEKIIEEFESSKEFTLETI